MDDYQKDSLCSFTAHNDEAAIMDFDLMNNFCGLVDRGLDQTTAALLLLANAYYRNSPLSMLRNEGPTGETEKLPPDYGR